LKKQNTEALREPDYNFAADSESVIAANNTVWFDSPTTARSLKTPEVWWDVKITSDHGQCATRPLLSPDRRSAACATEKNALVLFSLEP
jgi:hypothetical protein